MPFYTFKCRTCGLEETKLRQMGNDKEPLCPVCCYNPEAQDKAERMKKLISIPSRPHFKGKGFYETDYRKPEKGLPKELKPGLKQGNKKTDWELTQNKDGSGSLMKKNKKKKKKKNK